MRVLILGADGMLGHQVFAHLQERHDVRGTVRRALDEYAGFRLFVADNTYAETDARDTGRLMEIVGDFHPGAIINAIGIVKQREEANSSLQNLEINALFPHRLGILCQAVGARLIHMSTDCVFSGDKGSYSEDDIADARDLYGRSKFLGELHQAHTLTLRTSIIGLELRHKTSLVEWFLEQRGKIKGYRRAIYSGLTTMELARVIERLLVDHGQLSGVWHVASRPISKYDLLCRLAKELGRGDVEIEPDDTFVCDRSLDAGRFAQATGYTPPVWDDMLTELAKRIRRREGVR